MRGEARQRGEERPVVVARLAEADPRVEPDPVAGDAGVSRRGRPLPQEGVDLGHRVVVGGVPLHGAGLSPHVHRNNFV